MNRQTHMTYDELINNFNNNTCKSSSKINFIHNTGKDVYNISAPFNINNETFIAGRVESRDSEHSNIGFFKKEENSNVNYVIDETATPLELQDPFITFIKGELIVGGVHVFTDLAISKELLYETVFYRGSSVYDLKYFAKGPKYMKDIRLCDLGDKILVLTRPQGGENKGGKIGFTTISSVDELTEDIINKATILKNQFADDEWGGGNEIHILKNGLVGILAHVAKYDDKKDRHYASAVFTLNVTTGEYSPLKLIATKSQFDCNNTKRPDLIDVIFSGGLIRNDNNLATLYCGVSDCEGHFLSLQDPFFEYESL